MTRTQLLARSTAAAAATWGEPLQPLRLFFKSTPDSWRLLAWRTNQCRDVMSLLRLERRRVIHASYAGSSRLSAKTPTVPAAEIRRWTLSLR
jgi:hypothetical protein